MSRRNIWDAELRNPKIFNPTTFAAAQTLGATLTLDADMGDTLLLDPGGAGRTVLLPPEANAVNRAIRIINTADAAETLTVKEDSNTTTIGTVEQGEDASFFCDGTSWRKIGAGSQIVGGGLRVAAGVQTTVTATDTVVTGLATVLAAVAQFETDVADANMYAQAVVGNQSGAPAAGSIIIKTWKTTGTDPTPVAADAFSKVVSWIAIGT